MRHLLTFILLFISIHAIAQKKWISGSFANFSQYYMDDKKTGEFNEEKRFRSNNYLKLDGGFSNLRLGMQIEGYLPKRLINFSPSFNKEIGIATYYINFKNNQLDLTVGYFSEQFGNGLIFRSWEDKMLGLNNMLRGGKIKYHPYDFLQFTGIYGKHRVGFDVSDGEIYGFDTELSIIEATMSKNNSLAIGLSIVNRSENIEASANNFKKNTYAYSGRINYSKNSFYSNTEYVLKSKDALVEFDFVNTNSLSKGSALQINTGYSHKGFGINSTFRRLENMSFYSERNSEGNIDNEKLVNYLPSLTKQHEYSLANIYIYQTQSRLTFSPFEKSGEIGYQVDAYYHIRKKTILGGKFGADLSLNYSSWNGLETNFDILNRTADSKFLSFGKKYYTDLNIEIKKKLSKKWVSFFTYINLFYNKKYLEERSGKVNANIIISDVTYKIFPTKSIRFEAQHLWTNDDRNNWAAGTIELNLSTRLSLFANDTYNYGNEIKKIHYFNFGGSYSKNSTQLSLNYGRQRGGLLCVGGVCRIVPESTGIGFSIRSSF